MRTRVKICGITCPEDALVVADSAADAIGLVFYEKSPRNVSISQALEIASVLPPFIAVTGLFLDASSEHVRNVVDQVPLTLLQFHGDECADDCGQFGLPYIKAIGMQANTDVLAYARCYEDAAGILLDSHPIGAAGGTGKTFNWQTIPDGFDVPVILAGGLNPGNIAKAIKMAKPWGVDLSSGVESAPGIKDHTKIQILMNEVKSVDCRN